MRNANLRIGGLVLLAGGFFLAPAQAQEAKPAGHRLVIWNGPKQTIVFFSQGRYEGQWTDPAPAQTIPEPAAFVSPSSLEPAVLPYRGWGYSFYEPTPLAAASVLPTLDVPRFSKQFHLNQVIRLNLSR